MKVKQLIAKLQEFDGEAQVAVPIKIEVNKTITIRELIIIDIKRPSIIYGRNSGNVILISQ